MTLEAAALGAADSVCFMCIHVEELIYYNQCQYQYL